MVFGFLAQEKFARDETCLDRLSEPGVVGDEGVEPREKKSLSQRVAVCAVLSSLDRLVLKKAGSHCGPAFFVWRFPCPRLAAEMPAT